MLFPMSFPFAPHEGDSDEEERSPLPQNGGLWEEKGECKVQSQGEPKEKHDQPEGASIASLCGIAGSFGSRPDGFQHDPRCIGNPEENRVGGSTGKGQGMQSSVSQSKTSNCTLPGMDRGSPSAVYPISGLPFISGQFFESHP